VPQNSERIFKAFKLQRSSNMVKEVMNNGKKYFQCEECKMYYKTKELEKEGIIKRHSYNETPPRVEYNLTNKGKKLLKSLNSLIQWAEKNR